MSWSPKRRAHPATVRATCSYLHGGSPVSLGFRLPRLTRKPVVLGAAATLVAGVALAPAVASAHDGGDGRGSINHIVVIYEENHSFDNLFGSWERVNGLSHASAANTLQVNQGGTAYTCLKQN